MFLGCDILDEIGLAVHHMDLMCVWMGDPSAARINRMDIEIRRINPGVL